MFLQIKKILKDKSAFFLNIFQIAIFPIFMIIVGIFASAILNLGTYVGTFIRNVFELVMN